MSVVLETQKSLYAKLAGDSVLMALIKGVYEYVPQNAAYPYVTIGDVTANDDSAKGLKRYDLDVNLEIYSKAQGRKEVLDIIERLKLLLDNQVLSITGFTNIFTKAVGISTKRSSDNLITSGLLTLKIFVRENG